MTVHEEDAEAERQRQRQRQRYNPTPPPAAASDSPPDSSTPSSPHSSHSHISSPPPEDIPTTKRPPPPRYPPSSPPHVPYQDGFVGAGGREELEEGGRGGICGGGGGGRGLRPDLSLLKRVKRESLTKRVLLGSRVCGFVFCLVSFSVMAADREKGWALDSFYKYQEFRYCMALNVIGFAYSGLQGYDLAYQLTSGKLTAWNSLRYYLDFLMDQILTYLLLSASSSAAVRVDDWQSNWGKDKFPDMAKASVALSFLAFLAFAFSSLMSGYTLCILKSR